VIGAHGRVPVFAYRRPVDLRKGFEGLGALVQQALGKDPLSGALYLFTNRRRTTAKVLQFDGTGLTLYIKRLARGRFAALWEGEDATTLSLTRPELELFLQGSQLVGKVPLAPAVLREKDLVIRGCSDHR
jgi:transposase